jgi:hypothetical protein
LTDTQRDALVATAGFTSVLAFRARGIQQSGSIAPAAPWGINATLPGVTPPVFIWERVQISQAEDLTPQQIWLTAAMVAADQDLWASATVNSWVNNRRWTVGSLFHGSTEVWEIRDAGLEPGVPGERVAPGTANAVRVWETVHHYAPFWGPVFEFVTRTDLTREWVPGTPAIPPVDGTDGGFVAGIGRGGYRANNLHVGTRGMAGLSAHVYHEQYMRTGHLGSWRAATTETGTQNIDGINRVARNIHNGGIAHYLGVVTSTLIIQENIAGAFALGFGSPINFEFLDEDGNPHPGINVLGVQARAGTNGFNDARNRDDGTFYGGHRNNWMTFSGWMGALDQRMPVSPNASRLTDVGAEIFLANVAPTPAPGALEIRFFLSLEAGYEWKYGDAVYVTLSGAGVNNLPEADRRIRIGTAVDPIQTNITDGFTVSEVETGTLYNVIGRQPIADVVAEVINPNAFNIGDELWVYVTSDVLARSFDLNLSGIPTLSVEGSALRFDTGRLVNPQVGRTGREAVVFTVVRQPNANEEPTITISNLNVEGQAFPGVEYQIVLSGTSIANNDQEVYHALHIDRAYGTRIRAMNRGVFTSLPYHGTAVTNAGRADAPPPGELPPGVTPPPAAEFRLQEGVPFGGVADPLIWHIVGPNRVGMVSMRAFAVLIGSTDDQIVWNSETRVAEIRGTHFNGESVGIAVQMGNTNATVVHGTGEPQTVDIATAVNFLSGPAGTVEPLNIGGVVYLPLRFVAETFGFTVERQGNIVIFR